MAEPIEQGDKSVETKAPEKQSDSMVDTIVDGIKGAAQEAVKLATERKTGKYLSGLRAAFGPRPEFFDSSAVDNKEQRSFIGTRDPIYDNADLAKNVPPADFMINQIGRKGAEEPAEEPRSFIGTRDPIYDNADVAKNVLPTDHQGGPKGEEKPAEGQQDLPGVKETLSKIYDLVTNPSDLAKNLPPADLITNEAGPKGVAKPADKATDKGEQPGDRPAEGETKHGTVVRDKDQNVTKLEYPDGGSTSISYDKDHNPIELRDADNSYWHKAEDGSGWQHFR